jgi:L-lactate dehydrogenase complex protein LldG
LVEVTVTTAKEEMLARIRQAAAGAAVPQVPRDYRGEGEYPVGDPHLVELFVDRLEDYKAAVHRTTDAELQSTLDRITDGWSVVVPAGAPLTVAGARADRPLSHEDLDTTDAVLTWCAAACAETGTIVLDAGAAQGRRALSLVPDRHVCVVRTGQIVQTIPELLRRLDPVRPLTFISGPSATSDIELSRVEGVHGPRTLIVVLVLDA